MKFRVKSLEEIEKLGIFVKGSKSITSFVPTMKLYCGKVCEFYEPKKNSYHYQGEEDWFVFVNPPNYTWHKSWLISLTENNQYLLDFE